MHHDVHLLMIHWRIIYNGQAAHARTSYISPTDTSHHAAQPSSFEDQERHADSFSRAIKLTGLSHGRNWTYTIQDCAP